MGIREKFVGGKRGKGELEKEGVIWLETVERFEGRKKKGKKRLVGYERDQVVAGVSEMRTGYGDKGVYGTEFMLARVCKTGLGGVYRR